MTRILFLFILVSLISCKDENTSMVEETSVLSTELPEGFHEFYDKFHSDSLFQLSHIVFPLKGEMVQKDSMEVLSIEKVYEQDNWKLHRPFNAEAGYNRSFTAMGNLVIEKMQDDMGLLTIERRWGKVDTTWSLIFYGTTERSW